MPFLLRPAMQNPFSDVTTKGHSRKEEPPGPEISSGSWLSGCEEPRLPNTIPTYDLFLPIVRGGVEQPNPMFLLLFSYLETYSLAGQRGLNGRHFQDRHPIPSFLGEEILDKEQSAPHQVSECP